MFVPAEKEGWNPIVAELAGWGIDGYLLIVVLLGIPLGIITYPLTKYGRKPDSKKTE